LSAHIDEYRIPDRIQWTVTYGMELILFSMLIMQIYKGIHVVGPLLWSAKDGNPANSKELASP